MARIHIGTSGWSYSHWRGAFYPAALSAQRMLDHYARIFDCVEINNSFYRLPSAQTLLDWRRTVGPDFVFAVKASRFITHNKKLKDAQLTVPRLLERIAVLGPQLGPVLFQLPPTWSLNLSRLAEFLQILPQGLRFAMEFRHPAWHCQPVYALLRRHQVAFCIFELGESNSPHVITSDLVYVRLHGPRQRYQGSYGDEALRHWALRLRQWAKSGHEVFCFFDNDEQAYAALNGRTLNSLLEM